MVIVRQEPRHPKSQTPHQLPFRTVILVLVVAAVVFMAGCNVGQWHPTATPSIEGSDNIRRHMREIDTAIA